MGTPLTKGILRFDDLQQEAALLFILYHPSEHRFGFYTAVILLIAHQIIAGEIVLDTVRQDSCSLPGFIRRGGKLIKALRPAV